YRPARAVPEGLAQAQYRLGPWPHGALAASAAGHRLGDRWRLLRAGCAAKPAAFRLPASPPWQQPAGIWRCGGSCNGGRTCPAGAAHGTAGQDPTDRIGAETMVLDAAPAVDLAKHRPEARVTTRFVRNRTLSRPRHERGGNIA